MNRVSRRIVVMALAAPLAGLASACSGPDNPKPADVPQISITPDTTPPKIPNRQAESPYGASEKYKRAMDNPHGKQ
jgi:hypothetical protein